LTPVLASAKPLARLAAVERTVEHIDGILITHEHTDHCNGLPQMLGLWKAPLYVTEPYHGRDEAQFSRKRLASGSSASEAIQPGQHFTVGDIEVHAFAIPHDAAILIGFTFRSNGAKMAIVTDLGLHARARQGTSTRRRLPGTGVQSRSRYAQGGAVIPGW